MRKVLLRISQNKGFICSTILLAMSVGCTTTSMVANFSLKREVKEEDIQKVAVLPFEQLIGKEKIIFSPFKLERRRGENNGAFKKRQRKSLKPVGLIRNMNAGEIITDLFISELFNSVKVDIYDYKRIKKILKEMALNPDEVFKKASPQEIGRIIGVKSVFVGKVLDYSYLKHNFNALNTSRVSINATLVSSKTGKLLWSGSKAMAGKSLDLSIWVIQCPSAYELSSEVVKGFVESFKESIK